MKYLGTLGKILSMIDQGVSPTIEFTSTSDNHDYDKCMRAKVTSYIAEEEDGETVIILSTDFFEYRTYNKQFETPRWFTGRGDTVLWSESVYYPKDFKSDIYLDAEQDQEELKLIEDRHVLSLFDEYVNTEGCLTYTEWLEKELIAGRKTKAALVLLLSMLNDV